MRTGVLVAILCFLPACSLLLSEGGEGDGDGDAGEPTEPSCSGGVLSFDGEDDQMVIGADSFFNSTELTAAIWINPAALGNAAIVSNFRGPGNGQGWEIGITEDRIEAIVGTSNDRCTITGPILAVDTWTHVAFSYQERGRISLFVDGREVDQQMCPGGYRNNGFDLLVGAAAEAVPMFHYAGAVDDFTFSRTLTAVNFTPNDLSSCEGESAVYPLDEDSGPRDDACDRAPSGDLGILPGAADNAEPQRQDCEP